MSAVDETAVAEVARAAGAEATGIVAFVRGVEIDTPEQVQWAVSTAHQIRDQRRARETERDAVVKPLKDAVKRIGRWWKGPIDQLVEAERILKDGIAAARAREAAAQQAALEAAAATASPAEVAATVAAIDQKPAGLQERENWTYEIIDRAAIPADYYILDEKRIAREARALKQNLKIPGIKPVNKPTMVLR